MKKYVLMAVLGAMTLASCNTTTQPLSKAIGVLEVSFDSAGVATARLEPKLNSQAVTFRENDAVFGTGTTVVVNVVNSPYNYLVASFPVSHTGSSASAFQNLTLYALAKNGNVGDSAIKSITNFGGVTNTTEQARLARLVIPVHPVQASGNDIAMQTDADFQAFTSAEVTAATTAAGSAITLNDTVLNYGFSARCVTNCEANLRRINTNATGTIKIAVRVPKSASAYNFVMNFLVLDESVSRVTRGVFPSESITSAETRGTGVGATRMMQFGLNRGTTTLASDTVDDVLTSKLNTSIHALGLGRISAGINHTCGLTSSGAAYCWGSGLNGRLGNGAATQQNLPVAVSAPTGGSTLTFSSIAAGGSHTCGITSSGAAYCWGAAGFGQLGNGGAIDLNIPVAVSAPTGGSTLIFSGISAGTNHTCGLTSNGAAYCWGRGLQGRLGNGDVTDSNIPVAVSAPSGGSALTFSGIAAGNAHTCGITSSGVAYCWGRNNFGQLGNGGTTDSSLPVAVSGSLTFSGIATGTGGVHTCGITSSGAAYCWGFGSSGQLGNNGITDSLVPVAVSGSLTFSGIAAGTSHTCGMTLGGAAYCWGNGGTGQLGNGGTVSQNVPVAVSAPSGGSTLTFSGISVGENYTCGLTSSGTAYCWGSGILGRLGNGGTTNTSVPVSVNNTNYKL